MLTQNNTKGDLPETTYKGDFFTTRTYLVYFHTTGSGKDKPLPLEVR